MIRSILGSTKTSINDRFFISNSMGYTHMGHNYDSNAPPLPEHIAEERKDYQRIVVGDDLGS